MPRIGGPHFYDQKLEHWALQWDLINDECIFSSASQWTLADFQHLWNERTPGKKHGDWTCPGNAGRLVALNPESPTANDSYCWCWSERGKWFISHFIVEKTRAEVQSFRWRNIYFLSSNEQLICFVREAELRRLVHSNLGWIENVVGFPTGSQSCNDHHTVVASWMASVLTVVKGMSQRKS